MCSQNGLEWVKADKANVERARYVGFRATGDNATVTLSLIHI